MKHILKIILRNFISPITIAILLLAFTLLALGESRDAWFVSSVIIFNSILACIQEIRAYRILKKIELMTAPHARVLKNGKYIEVSYDKVALGDNILIKSGDEIPADAKIIESKIFEVDEALLTGESSPIKKRGGDMVLASSIVISGEAKAGVVAIGDKTHAGEMTKKLKAYKPTLTPLQKRISHAISFLTYLALGLAVLIFFTYSASGENLVTIFQTITSAAVVVVPEGLLLASSLFFAYGSIRLSQAKVLAQKISAIEGLALVDVLATDKTGTLTSPEIIFNKIELLNNADRDDVKRVLKSIAQETGDNSTSRAILKKFKKLDLSRFIFKKRMAFSSARKISGLQFVDNEQIRSVVLGAPEYILRLSETDDKLSEKINQLSEKGLRVLLLAEFEKTEDPETLLRNKEKLSPLAIISLKNELRDKVVETVDFLQKNNVTVKVISGDNPKTVSYIAREAGIKDYDSYITGDELKMMTDHQLKEAANKNAIFARVLPNQKEQIIKALKNSDLHVGMVGDGVNDALSVKESDLGIAMFDGAPATRRVADLVLLNNSFAALPQGIKIGNQIMQSIETIAILFFHKIILGLTILLATMFLGMNYPFLPRHVTYVNVILVTLPTIIVTLFPPEPIHRINPKYFWKDTLLSIAPIAILSGLSISVIYWIMATLNSASGHTLTDIQITTSTAVAVGYFGALMMFISGIILDFGKGKNAFWKGRIIYLVLIIVFSAVIFQSDFLSSFFDFSLPKFQSWFFASFIVMVVTVAQLAIAKFMRDRISKRLNQ